MGVNSLPKTVTRQHHGCDLNPGPSAPESSMLTLGYRATLTKTVTTYNTTSQLEETTAPPPPGKMASVMTHYFTA